MNYDKQYNTGENMSYSSTHNYKKISQIVGDIISSAPYREAEEKRKKEEAILKNNEKGFTAQLIELGKLCHFIEKFDNIKLNEQKIPQIGPFENPTECASFVKGYQTAQILIDNGFSEENYHNFAENYENKYKVKNSKQK